MKTLVVRPVLDDSARAEENKAADPVAPKVQRMADRKLPAPKNKQPASNLPATLAGQAEKFAGLVKNSDGSNSDSADTPTEPSAERADSASQITGTVDVSIQTLGSLAHKDPKMFLLALMNDIEADVKLRADAAKALMPFMHSKIGEGGKKEQRQEAAKKVAGRFASAMPPKLVAAGGKKV